VRDQHKKQKLKLVPMFWSVQAVKPHVLVDSIRGLSPWTWRQEGCTKRCYPYTTSHGVTAQKTATWIFIAVKPQVSYSRRLFWGLPLSCFV
jgi:hypothetical protein